MTQFRPREYQRLPPVIKNLIIINVIFVLIQYVLGQYGIDLAEYLGLHYWRSRHFHWWQLLTHMFMHGSYNDVQGTINHIFFNMFALWMFGSILENVWGGKRFLIFYLICGLGAALCHLSVLGIEYESIQKAFTVYEHNATLDQFDLFIKEHVPLNQYNQLCVNLYNIRINWMNFPSATHPVNESITAIHQYLNGYNDMTNHVYYSGVYDEATVGASGAVFGVLFAFGYLFPNMELLLFFVVPIKAKWAVTGYAIIELVLGLRNSAGDNVAHFAHLGGMLFAFILLRIWNRTNRKEFY